MPTGSNNDERISKTILSADETGGLGKMEILHPPGTFALTPASLISIYAIGTNRRLLGGNGIDWGSGTGCLAIAAAKIVSVRRVVGLEIQKANVRIARKNAGLNRVSKKTEFIWSDSYRPVFPRQRVHLETLCGKIAFVLANPPASDDGDGFEYRRRVLEGAREYLRCGGRVFLSISSQYGMQRTRQLQRDVPGFFYGGILATTRWVPFDLRRPDLLESLRLYAKVEERGGLAYTFRHPGRNDRRDMAAKEALAHFETTGQSPLSRWQTHLFEYA